MIQLGFKVRADTGQLMQYTFRDQYGVVIDLTNYVSVSLLTKFQGAVYSSVSAAFVLKSAGTVQAVNVIFPSPNFGIWDAQFVCTDAGGFKLYGEPVQFRCVSNVPDLGLAELPLY